MTGLGPHAVFILAAYGFTLLVIAALVIGIVVDTRAQKRRLLALQARGVGRRPRNEPGNPPKPMSSQEPINSQEAHHVG